MLINEQTEKKWQKLLEHEELPKIDSNYKRRVTTIVLENQEKALKEQAQELQEAGPNNVTAGVSKWDPVLISLVRRTMPNLMAFDIMGVQPMSGPTGLVFAMKSRYSTQAGTEALFNEANSAFSGTGTHAGDSSSLPGTGAAVDTTPADGVADDFDYGTGLGTAAAELLNTGAGGAGTMSEMAFSIEKATVTAKSRALKAGYSVELAQDLKAVHGLDADTELSNILQAEVLAEINREAIRTVNVKAQLGCQQAGLAAGGIFDLVADADGRWSVERYKGLVFQLEREANAIAKLTRRGKGNFIICSSDVAAALMATGLLQYNPQMSTNLNVDDTGNTFAGVLNGRIKVYIDPYAGIDYVNVGFRGSNPYDAGMFYCPYVPLTPMRTIGEDDFQPRIGLKTRYGMVANPFAESAPVDDTGANRANPYYRIFRVNNLLS